MPRPDVFQLLRARCIEKSHPPVQEFHEQPASLKLRDLTTLTNLQKDELQQSVRQNAGVVQLIVHPYFGENAESSRYGSIYVDERDVYLRECFAKGLPLIIFEEESELPYLPNRMDGLLGTAYTVSTLPTQSYPVTHEALKTTLQTLKQVGTKHIEIGGRFLTFSKPSPEEKPFVDDFKKAAKRRPHARQLAKSPLLPGDCVGGAVRWLVGSFDVSFSGISEPETGLTDSDTYDTDFPVFGDLFTKYDPNKSWG